VWRNISNFLKVEKMRSKIKSINNENKTLFVLTVLVVVCLPMGGTVLGVQKLSGPNGTVGGVIFDQEVCAP
jgi:hypothetical protein